MGPYDGISVLVSRERSKLTFSLPCKDTERRQLSTSQEESPYQELNRLAP